MTASYAYAEHTSVEAPRTTRYIRTATSHSIIVSRRRVINYYQRVTSRVICARVAPYFPRLLPPHFQTDTVCENKFMYEHIYVCSMSYIYIEVETTKAAAAAAQTTEDHYILGIWYTTAATRATHSRLGMTVSDDGGWWTIGGRCVCGDCVYCVYGHWSFGGAALTSLCYDMTRSLWTMNCSMWRRV